MPQSENLDAAGLCVDLVVEVIAGAAQEEASNSFPAGLASACPDSGLGSDELEGPLEILDEGKGRVRAIGTPPSRRSPDLRGSPRRRLDDQPRNQGLLAKLPEERLRIDELPLCGLLE